MIPNNTHFMRNKFLSVLNERIHCKKHTHPVILAMIKQASWCNLYYFIVMELYWVVSLHFPK